MLERAIDAVRRLRPKRVVFFTGAGVSAESGIPTFRGEGGLWRNFRAEELATPEAFARDPELVLEWYGWRRELIRQAQPNAAHLAIARVEDGIVVTQNVDGLHTRAGSRDVIELHGNIFRERPAGNYLRPDVVWFGEMLPPAAVDRAVSAIQEAELLLVIGTSSVVYPAAGLVTLHRGLSIEINPQPGAACTISLPMTAVEATPAIVDAILESR